MSDKFEPVLRIQNPDELMTKLEFHGQADNGEPISYLKLTANGDVFVYGQKVTNNRQIYEAMWAWLQTCQCVSCHQAAGREIPKP